MSYLLQSTLKQIEEYLTEDTTDNPVSTYAEPEALKQQFDFSLGKAKSEESMSDFARQYLELSVNTGNKQFLNQLFQGKILPGFVGDLLAVATNSSQYTYEVSPLGTLMEQTLIDKMNSLVGFEKGDGTFSTGGSNSNLLAVLCAKHRKFPHTKEKGLYGEKPLAMFVSEKSHYSFQKAAFTLGIGTENLVKLPTNQQHEVIPEALEAALEKSIAEGKEPFFIAATSSTTELGAFDPIEKMGEIAKKYNCWYHVDGSWGGSIILSEKHRHLFNGLSQADSFAWNAHKLMNVPLICAILLVKDPEILYGALSSTATDYIFHDDDNASCDLGVKSLQCGKRNDALKLWFAWKALGDDGYAALIDNVMDLAQQLTNKIEENPELELLAPTKSLNVNFRYTGKLPEDRLNEANLAIRERLWKSGKSMVNFCHLGETISIRMVIANLQWTEHDMEHFYDLFLQTAQEVEKEIMA